MTYLTGKVRHENDKVNYNFGIFVEFQKAFGTVDHHNIEKTNIS